MKINYSKIDSANRYKLMAQSVIPRPIAWIVTENGGVLNLAPFSYFTPLSSNPATLIVSVGHKEDGTPKDTLYNLRKDGRCTLCLVSPKLLEPMHFSSKALESNISEIEEFNIEMEEIFEGYPPMVKGVPFAFACNLLEELDLKGSKTKPIILEVQEQYIDDKCITDKENLYLDCDLLARVGANYAKLGEKIQAPKIP